MKVLVLITSLVFFLSCSKKKLPSDIFPPEKMQAILWDLMRADQFVGNYILNKDTTKNVTAESLKYYAQIFAIHKVSREEFQKSFAYYRAHPELFKSIMDSISTPDKAIVPDGSPVNVSPTAPADPLPLRVEATPSPVKKTAPLD